MLINASEDSARTQALLSELKIALNDNFIPVETRVLSSLANHVVPITMQIRVTSLNLESNSINDLSEAPIAIKPFVEWLKSKSEAWSMAIAKRDNIQPIIIRIQIGHYHQLNIETIPFLLNQRWIERYFSNVAATLQLIEAKNLSNSIHNIRIVSFTEDLVMIYVYKEIEALKPQYVIDIESQKIEDLDKHQQALELFQKFSLYGLGVKLGVEGDLSHRLYSPLFAKLRQRRSED